MSTPVSDTTKSPWTFSTAIAAAAVIFSLAPSLAGVGAAVAQAMPDGDKGRYSMSTVGNGVIRLDTRSGSVSTCNNGGAGWACYAVPDERAALDAEIGRLQADNDRLKAELAARDLAVTGKVEEALPKESLEQTLPKTDSLKKPDPKLAEGARKIEIPLPSDRDMDRMMSFLERAWKRLIEMADRVQKDVSGRI